MTVIILFLLCLVLFIFFGGVSFPEWQDRSLPLAVGNIVLGFLLNSSSYEDGISLFFLVRGGSIHP